MGWVWATVRAGLTPACSGVPALWLFTAGRSFPSLTLPLDPGTLSAVNTLFQNGFDGRTSVLPGKRFRISLKKLALAVFIPAALLLLLELSLRFSSFHYTPREKILWTPSIAEYIGTYEYFIPTSLAPPGYVWRAQPNTQLTDSHGFRLPGVPDQKAPDKIRIAFLGGSTTLSGYHAYPERTIRLMNEAAGTNRYEHLNAACSSYSTHQSLIALKRWVLPLKPDQVVVYHGWNDGFLQTDGYSDLEKDALARLGVSSRSKFARWIRSLKITEAIGQLLDASAFLNQLQLQQKKGEFGEFLEVFREDACHLYDFGNQKLAEFMARSLAPERAEAIARLVNGPEYQMALAEESLREEDPFAAVYYAERVQQLSSNAALAARCQKIAEVGAGRYEFARLFREARWGGRDGDFDSKIRKLRICQAIRSDNIGVCLQILRVCHYMGRAAEAVQFMDLYQPSSDPRDQYEYLSYLFHSHTEGERWVPVPLRCAHEKDPSIRRWASTEPPPMGGALSIGGKSIRRSLIWIVMGWLWRWKKGRIDSNFAIPYRGLKPPAPMLPEQNTCPLDDPVLAQARLVQPRISRVATAHG